MPGTDGGGLAGDGGIELASGGYNSSTDEITPTNIQLVTAEVGNVWLGSTISRSNKTGTAAAVVDGTNKRFGINPAGANPPQHWI